MVFHHYSPYPILGLHRLCRLHWDYGRSGAFWCFLGYDGKQCQTKSNGLRKCGGRVRLRTDAVTMEDQAMLDLRKSAARWLILASDGDYPTVKRLVGNEIELVQGKVPHVVGVALRQVIQSADTQAIDAILHALAEAVP